MKKIILVIVSFLLLTLLTACNNDTSIQQEEVNDSQKVSMDKENEKQETDENNTENTQENQGIAFEYKGELFDVTKWEVVTWIDTKNLATGIAQSTFENGNYTLLVDFDNLPDPTGTDFYEWWIVRKGIRFSVISTGKLQKIDGKYQNNFGSWEDLTDHDFYVLTIEPDDGNPEPAEHILEGTMSFIVE